MNINDLTPDQVQKIAAVCTSECIRQGDSIDRVSYLLAAYQWILEHGGDLPTEEDALHVAGILEPKNGGAYRKVPVTFRNGRGAATPDTVPHAVKTIFAHLDGTVPADAFVHAYVDVHPLVDGNGRTGFLLYNWIKGTLLNPEPLPYWEW